MIEAKQDKVWDDGIGLGNCSKYVEIAAEFITQGQLLDINTGSTWYLQTM